MIMDEWIFHCDTCKGRFDITNLEIHGWPEDDPKMCICHGCYILMKKEVKS